MRLSIQLWAIVNSVKIHNTWFIRILRCTNWAYETFDFSSMSTTMVRIGDNFIQFIFIKFTVVLNSTSYVCRKLEKTLYKDYDNADGLKLY